MTGQSVLDLMEVINQELQLQAGEANVARGLTALNAAQDYFESLAASRGKLLGGQTGTVATAQNTESTTYPTGLLRLDRLHVLDTNSRPKVELSRLSRTGGHAASSTWPLNLTQTSTGEPRAYWTNGTSIYWSPLPSATFTVRWYGFQAAAAITASGTFLYPDIVALPLASFACKLLKLGIDDPTQDVAAIAMESFKSTLDALANFNRDGATPLEYSQVHDS